MANVENGVESQRTTAPGLSGPGLAVALIALGLVALLAMRRFEWSVGWFYVSLSIATLLVNLICLLIWNPELIRRRAGFRRGTKTWDIVWLVSFGPSMLAMFWVAFLELRAAEPGPPGAAWLIGLLLFVSGWALAIWAMVVNPFFEKTVRIQTDHGHRVIDSGPYVYVRHPGYVGFLAWILSTPLLLASTWAFVPTGISIALLVLRTALEDRTLRQELAGYAEYAQRVRYRLVPGLW